MVIEISGGEGQNFESRELLKRNKELDDAIVLVREDVEDMQENIEELSDELDSTNNDLHELDTNVINFVERYENKVIASADGSLVDNSNNDTSGFIKLQSGKTYTFNASLGSDYPRFAYYTADKTFIRRDDGTNANSQTFTMPSNASYMRFFVGKTSYNSCSIIAIGDLGNKVASVNASLNDYGFDNFAGEFQQGYWSLTDLSLVNNSYNVCNKTPLSVTNGDIVTVKVSGSKHIRIIFSNGTSVIATDKKDNVSEFSMIAPSGSTKVYINVDGNTTTITPTTVGHIGVYINNEIDEVKTALDVEGYGDVFNITPKLGLNIKRIPSSASGNPAGTVSGTLQTMFPIITEGSQIFIANNGQMWSRAYFNGAYTSWVKASN